MAKTQEERYPHWHEEVSYQALHKRINNQRGTAKFCCFGCTGQKRYNWANLTDDLVNPWDYAAMCRRCHIRYDDARRSMLEDTVTSCRTGVVKLTQIGR